MKQKQQNKDARNYYPVKSEELFFDSYGSDLLNPIEIPILDEIEFQEKFYQTILGDAPANIKTLKVLAELFIGSGKHTNALEIKLRLSNLLPYDEVVHYHLACAYAATGLKDMALRSLGRAIELGFDDLRNIRNNEDFSKLKADLRFQTMVQELSARLHASEKAMGRP